MLTLLHPLLPALRSASPQPHQTSFWQLQVSCQPSQQVRPSLLPQLSVLHYLSAPSPALFVLPEVCRLLREHLATQRPCHSSESPRTPDQLAAADLPQLADEEKSALLKGQLSMTAIAGSKPLMVHEWTAPSLQAASQQILQILTFGRQTVRNGEPWLVWNIQRDLGP
mmetsp:Transcript_30490/g.87453  ORF Transcript_30490/g.87453 Transcript_30490/m.87453 type:complete len:168 (-) Transcript_30490:20-523(-)